MRISPRKNSRSQETERQKAKHQIGSNSKLRIFIGANLSCRTNKRPSSFHVSQFKSGLQHLEKILKVLFC